jgi:Tfp pilus assembly protein PilF
MQLLDQHFGPGRSQLRSFSMARADQSDEYHQTQLREKPDDPNTHSNYGAYLQNKKGDLEGAEREYQKAIDLDGNHVNALGNLANLLWKKGDRGQAANLYRKALEADPGNANITLNYGRFLLEESGSRQKVRDLLNLGITAHPENRLLLLLRAELSLLDGAALDALEDFRRAREKGANQAEVENGYAVALQMSGASVGECIAAYRVAITLNPENGALRLNLAQLMFIRGDHTEANRLLHDAMRLGLDASAQLEAQFYILAHNPSDPAVIFQMTKTLLTGGGRLRWDVGPNIEKVRQSDPQKAALLEIVSEVMKGERDQLFLDQALARWPR